MLFGSRQTAVELYTLHPEPAQLFRLWQVYLDNVNPLLKVTHTPTLQGRIVEAASNLKEVPSTLEALMFGIYCMAILSLTVEECETMFKQPKEELSTRFQFGCQQALLNSNFLRTGSRDCLTALFLYLVRHLPRSALIDSLTILGVCPLSQPPKVHLIHARRRNAHRSANGSPKRIHQRQKQCSRSRNAPKTLVVPGPLRLPS